ncbi:MAG: hypothetical protein OQJ97_09070 [Rhodospirillales bacterium]|nr:hypothetical protein [Rhodospirillales bacterium]
MFTLETDRISGLSRNQPEPTSDSQPEQPKPEEAPPVMTIENQAIPFEDKLEGIMATLFITEPGPLSEEFVVENENQLNLDHLIEDGPQLLSFEMSKKEVTIISQIEDVESFDMEVAGMAYSITDASLSDFSFALAAEG